jgi:ribonuclease-3 family protein
VILLEEYINKIDLQIISNQTLAFIGDAVYNVYIRSYLASKSNMQTGILHRQSIKYVSAKAQSRIIDNIIKNLSEDEMNIYKRGRNTNITTVSKNVDVIEYKKATGFEALIGELYIQKKIDRLEEIIKMSIKIVESI